MRFSTNALPNGLANSVLVSITARMDAELRRNMTGSIWLQVENLFCSIKYD